jgi:hypothetical protein
LKISGYPLALAAISVGVLSLFLAPSVWAASTVWEGAETRAPTAGPQVGLGEMSSRFGSGGDEIGPLVGYLRANQGDAEYLVAAIRSRIASPIILNTDEPVIAFGGFQGDDAVFSDEELAGLVGAGAVRFFVIEERDIEQAEKAKIARRRLEPGEQEHLEPLPRLKARLEALADAQALVEAQQKRTVRWITDNCEQVPKASWQSTNSTVLLYDCGAGVR